MQSFSLYARDGAGLSDAEIRAALVQSIEGCAFRRVLLLPPDHTRLHSGADRIVHILWELLSSQCEVDVMPALGTHAAMTEAEWREMYAPIPYEKMIVHNWRADVACIGEVPAAFIREVSDGWMDEPVAVEVNRRLLDSGYDLILSIGQVVPHEVVGMANQSKNLFVGCGGANMINASHMLGARYGLERIMGRDRTPVRAVFDYAEAHFLQGVPIVYLLTVTTAPGGDVRIHGLFAGRERARFEEAVRLSQQKNVFYIDRPVEHAVVWLDPDEFKSTWLGNKAVYRTRMAMADGGELLILAPGVERFGEDPAIDALIRRYGYRGREAILAQARERSDLRENLSAAAHLIHGSSDGRFRITYCTRRLSGDEVRGVGYDWISFDEAVRRFDPARLRPGWNDLPDGPAYFIPNPALGLWSARKL